MPTEAIIPAQGRSRDREGLATAPEPALSLTLDFVLALVLLAASLPLLVVIALLVKLTSRGPVLYSQVRLGKGGKPYTLYKIRTMVVDSEKHGARWSKPGDTRITKLGLFLRKTHLDELPQLWNILRSDMRLIGPRPERPEFVPALAEAIPSYCDRLQVRPGITGLAQVQVPADTDLDSVRAKLAYDLWYLRHRSFRLDICILLATVFKLCGVSFRTLRGWFGFPLQDEVALAYREASAAAQPIQPENVPAWPQLVSPIPAPALALHLLLNVPETTLPSAGPGEHPRI